MFRVQEHVNGTIDVFDRSSGDLIMVINSENKENGVRKKTLSPPKENAVSRKRSSRHNGCIIALNDNSHPSVNLPKVTYCENSSGNWENEKLPLAKKIKLTLPKEHVPEKPKDQESFLKLLGLRPTEIIVDDSSAHPDSKLRVDVMNDMQWNAEDRAQLPSCIPHFDFSSRMGQLLLNRVDKKVPVEEVNKHERYCQATTRRLGNWDASVRGREEAVYQITYPFKRETHCRLYYFTKSQKRERRRVLYTGLDKTSRQLKRLCKDAMVCVTRLPDAEIRMWTSRTAQSLSSYPSTPLEMCIDGKVVIQIDDSDEESVTISPKTECLDDTATFHNGDYSFWCSSPLPNGNPHQSHKKLDLSPRRTIISFGTPSRQVLNDIDSALTGSRLECSVILRDLSKGGPTRRCLEQRSSNMTNGNGQSFALSKVSSQTRNSINGGGTDASDTDSDIEIIEWKPARPSQSCASSLCSKPPSIQPGDVKTRGYSQLPSLSKVIPNVPQVEPEPDIEIVPIHEMTSGSPRPLVNSQSSSVPAVHDDWISVSAVADTNVIPESIILDLMNCGGFQHSRSSPRTGRAHLFRSKEAACSGHVSIDPFENHKRSAHCMESHDPEIDSLLPTSSGSNDDCRVPPDRSGEVLVSGLDLQLSQVTPVGELKTTIGPGGCGFKCLSCMSDATYVVNAAEQICEHMTTFHGGMKSLTLFSSVEKCGAQDVVVIQVLAFP